MPIRFRCPSCQQALSVTSRKAGKTVRCPACQSALRVPTPKAESPREPEPAPVVEPAAASPPEPEPAPVVEPVAVAKSIFGPVMVEEPESEEEEFELRRAQPEFEEMDLTQMVDVTFLLLSFFMITASFTMQKAIGFPPPSPDEQGASVQPKQLEDFEDECVIVEIHEDNSISIDEERIPLDATLAAMLATKGKNEMLIDAHENALHETVVKVGDAGNEVQMQRSRLGARGG